MKRSLSILLTTAVVLTTVFGCSSSSTSPTDADGVKRSNMRPDSAIGWLYYSLDGDSVVPASQSETSAWDVRMAYLRCCGNTKQIDVLLNSGTAGPGSTQGAMVQGRFEDITAVPSGVTLTNDDTAIAWRIVPVAVIGPNVMFVYDLSTHTISPSPDRCLLIRTANGNTYKFQFTSIYKDAIGNPNLNTPMGYYHFRYKKL